jgi:hypothetical protein
MRPLLRLALIWLIALAVPLQGVAAVSMAVCGPGHARMLPAAGIASSMKHAAHDHAAGVAVHHRGQHAAGAMHEMVADHEASSDVDASQVDKRNAADKLAQLAKFKCSACASCCTGAAFPASIVSFDLPKESHVFLASPVVANAIFLTGGQDRPPRSSLA